MSANLVRLLKPAILRSQSNNNAMAQISTVECRVSFKES